MTVEKHIFISYPKLFWDYPKGIKKKKAVVAKWQRKWKRRHPQRHIKSVKKEIKTRKPFVLYDHRKTPGLKALGISSGW